MPEYFLSALEHHRYEQRARWSALSQDARPGYLRLLNKNTNETLFVRIVNQCPNRHGWIVECESVPDYFRRVLVSPEARVS